MELQDRPDYDELVRGFRPSWLEDIRGYRAEQELIAAFKQQREHEARLAGEWLDDTTYRFDDGELLCFDSLSEARYWASSNDISL